MCSNWFATAARRNIYAAIACAALLATYATTSWLSWRTKGLTFDEPLHLVDTAIQTQEHTFAFDPENPPSWKYYFSIGNPAIHMKLDVPSIGWKAFFHDSQAMRDYSTHVFYQTPGNDPHALVRTARLRMLLLAVVLDGLIAWCAWQFAGPLAAVVAAAAFSLDPNFLAHGLIVKNDVPVAMLATALAIAVWRAGRAATLLNSFTTAFLLGVIITTKFSGLLAFPIVAVSLFARVLIPSDWPVLRFTARTWPQRLGAAAAIGLFTILFSWGFIWICYGARYQSAPDETLDRQGAIDNYAASQTVAVHRATLVTLPGEFHQWLSQWHPDHFVRIDQWIDKHRLLPHQYATGMMYGIADSLSRGAFFMGDRRFYGWWYYFPFAIAFKTPVATLVALALAAVVSCFLSFPRNAWAICAFSISPIIYMLAAMHSGLDIGIRHILPVYPFLYIFLGIAVGRAAAKFGKPVKIILVVLFFGLAAETFAAFPDYIPFFNVAVGGYRGGARLRGDSNLDWGQELPDIARWQAKHTGYQLMLYYWGSGDPRYYGIHYARLPESFAPPDQRRPTGQKPYWAISVVALQGSALHPKEYAFYAPFRVRKPTEILGGCIYLYAPW
jgi:hypothetical protein